MLSPIEPRCTGMCGALAIRLPAASKMAQLKSSRSLMLTEYAVFCKRRPICSAIDMNRLLKISSITGSAVVPMAPLRQRLDAPHHQMVVGRDLGLPARFDDGGGIGLGDDGRSLDDVADARGVALEQRRLAPLAGAVHRRHRVRHQ